MAPTTETLRVGLRFNRRDAPKLRALADRAAHHELGDDAVNVFSGAAIAASTGEPLIVIATSRAEIALMVAGYARYGLDPPAVEL